ncbi:MAG TPA: glycine oxidase ThiO [Candidatus Angelobacter sp.]
MISPDVIIAGAGIIGLSTALELRRRGAQVLVLDRGEPGQEASSAAAGMLAPSDPETPLPLRPLAFLSAKLYPEYVQDLETVSGIKVDYRRHGTIAFIEGHRVPPQYRRLSSEELSRMEPAVEARGSSAFFVAEDSVDPVMLVRAALAAAKQNGIDVRPHTAVDEICARGSAIEVTAGSQRLAARAAVNCRGAWSGAPVKPRKGQSMYVQPQRRGLLEHVLVAPGVYLVPRSSGKILIGATVEDVGYDRAVEPATIGGLHHAAAQLVPELASTPVTESWAGLRPGSPDDLPLLGATETPGLFIASGHFRNGILLAPVTARIMADLVMGKPAEMDVSAFSPLRFAAVKR